MAELLYNELTFAVIGAAMEVHRILGPGFLEAVYQATLERELSLRGILFEKKVRLPVTYKEIVVGIYEADLVVDGKFIVEIKAVSKLSASHHAQAMHYFAATGCGSLFCSTSVLVLSSIAESSNKSKRNPC